MTQPPSTLLVPRDQLTLALSLLRAGGVCVDTVMPGIATPPDLRIFTDGGFSQTDGTGAWAYVHHAGGQILQVQDCRRPQPTTSAARMELKAIIEGLKAARRLDRVRRIQIIGDNAEVIRNCREVALGTLTRASYDPDLWQALRDVLTLIQHGGREVEFTWVRGHAGNPGNERAHQAVSDVLAQRRGVPRPTSPRRARPYRAHAAGA